MGSNAPLPIASVSAARGWSARDASLGRRPRAPRWRSTGSWCEHRGPRRHARTGSRLGALPDRARASGRRARRRREPPASGRPPEERAADRERPSAGLRCECQPRRQGDGRGVRRDRQPGYGPRTGGREGLTRLRLRARSLRHRRPAAALSGRALAALSAPLSDGNRHARPPDPASLPAASLRAAARPLPARRATAQTRAGGLDARRLPADAARDAGRAGRLRRTLSALRRGHRALLPRGESRLGALVRARGGGDAPLRRGDRPPSADAPHPLALARDCPLRAQTSGAVARAVTPNVRVVIPTYDAK